MGAMYNVEQTLRKKYFGENGSNDYTVFSVERRSLVEPILADLKTWLDAKVLEVLPSSALGTAISYMRELWPRLVRYLDCPFLTPDNNEALCSGIRNPQDSGKSSTSNEKLRKVA